VQFSTSDPIGTVPNNAALTSGTGSFNATLKTAGGRTITATDSATSTISGTSNTINVIAGAATHFSLAAPGISTAGAGFSFTVTARDLFNNTATSYLGAVKFSSSDGIAGLPVNSTLTAGVGTFNTTLKTVGSQVLTATDTVTSSTNGSTL